MPEWIKIHSMNNTFNRSTLVSTYANERVKLFYEKCQLHGFLQDEARTHAGQKVLTCGETARCVQTKIDLIDARIQEIDAFLKESLEIDG